ncbi:MAG: GPW/gp25 family protein [bacterium]|nr:GPW/gp25 family protein [bacterium]
MPFALRRGFLKKSDLYDSIYNSIGIILSTRKGTLPFDMEFGCDLWDREYSDLFMVNRSDVQGSVRNAINKYEPRLSNVSVSLIRVDTGPNHPLGVSVKVIGNYREDKDEKRFEETFNVG